MRPRRLHLSDLTRSGRALIGPAELSAPPPLDALVRCYRVSARTVERKMLHSTGHTPSLLRRVLRFRRAFRMLGDAPPGTWARVAAPAGYFDQAHLIRDFRRFAGAGPSEFFRAGPDLAVSIMGRAGERE